jgi:hypothetical protein
MDATSSTTSAQTSPQRPTATYITLHATHTTAVSGGGPQTVISHAMSVLPPHATFTIYSPPHPVSESSTVTPLLSPQFWCSACMSVSASSSFWIVNGFSMKQSTPAV